MDPIPPNIPRAQAYNTPRHGPSKKRIAAVVVAVLLIMGAALAWALSSPNKSSPAASGKPVSVPLNDLAPAESGVVAQLQVNGGLRVNGSFVLTPTTRPANPVAGQQYVDQTNGVYYYFNGQTWINLGPTDLSGLTAQLANKVDLQQSGSTVPQSGNIAITGSLGAGSVSATVVAATTLSGSGQNITNLNASNITTGVIGDALLSANVALLNRPSQTFTGAQLLQNLSDSLAAFSVQRSSGEGVLRIDTTNNRVVIGDQTGSGTLLVVDSAPTIGLPSGLNGGLIYDATTNRLKVFENGQYKTICNTTDGCGALVNPDLQTVYNNSAAPTSITTTALAKTILFQAGAGFDATDLFAVKSAGGTTVFRVDTQSNRAVATAFQGDGALLTNLNATNVTSGTLADARLSSNVTLHGNTFNAAGELVQLNGLGQLPAVSGALLINLNASSISSGTLADARLSTNVTQQGNTFNGANQLVQLNALGQLPAVSGVNLTALNATNIASGTLNDARLSANVALLGRDDQVFSGDRQVFSNTTNDENALIVQSAGNVDTLFKVDTQNNRVVIGDVDNTSPANTTLFVVDAASTANLPTGVNGGIIYDVTTNQFKIFENGQYKVICNQTDGNCGGAGSNTLQGVYDNSSSPASIVTTSGTKTILIKAGVGFNAANLFEIQNDAGTAILTIDSTANKVIGNLFEGSGANLTALNASNISSGTLADARLSTNVTQQGNTFNGANELVQLNALGQLPAVSGVNLTALNATNISSGTLNDARLSANVALLDRLGQIFTGTNLFQSDDAAVLQIQNAAASQTVFTANAAANRVVIGDADSTSAANTTLLVVDAASTANLPTGVNGGIIYDTTTNQFKVFENGQYKVICNQTDGNCGGSGGGATLQSAYDNSPSPASIVTTSGTKTILIKAGVGFDAAKLFEIQNAAGNTVFVADSTGSRVGIGTAPTTKLDIRASNDGIQLLSGASNAYTYLGLGRTSVNAYLALAATNGQFFTDALAGDLLLRVSSGNLRLGTGSGNSSLVIDTPNGNLTYRPRVDNSTAFQILNAATTNTVFLADTSLARIGINKTAASYTLDVAGDVNIDSGNVYRINGTQIGSTNLADASNVALLNRNSQTFTGNNQLFKNGTNSTTAFQIQNAAGTTTLLRADTSATNGRVYVTNLEATKLIASRQSAATDYSFAALVSGDADDRFRIRSDGQLEWGSGGAAPDITLKRNSTFGLQINNAFGILRANATDAAIQTAVTGDSVSRFTTLQDGKLLWGDGTNAADTNLYRSGSDILKTDDALVVVGNLTFNGKLITGGSTPTATVDPNAGNTATCTVSGNDTSGQITLTTNGVGQSAGLQCTITYNSAFSSAPRTMVSPVSIDAGANSGYYADSSTTALSLYLALAPSAGVTIIFNYFNPQ